MSGRASEIIVAGVNGNTISEDVYRLLTENDTSLFCSSSLLKIVISRIPSFDKERWSSVVPITDCFEKIRSHQGRKPLIILVSGDPLFYGLGKKLKQTFPETTIHFLPAVSYMQSCFSHFGMSWDDAEIVSLHGRPVDLLETRLNASKLFIFTDPENSPDRIADYLENRLDSDDVESLQIMVGECIGTEKQRFSNGTIEEISSMSFSQPNCMIVVNRSVDPAPKLFTLGLREDDIDHSRGLITKNEVRAAVIHRLRLPETGVLWDIGAGSGSISLEAARLFPSLTVFAIEKNDEQIAHIRANKKRYQCRNIRVVCGEAPDVLDTLVLPDRVFIGGSGGRIKDIVQRIGSLAIPPPRVVITAVLARTASVAPEILHRYSYRVDISIVQVTRCSYPEMKKNVLNPIHIICGRKSHE